MDPKGAARLSMYHAYIMCDELCLTRMKMRVETYLVGKCSLCKYLTRYFINKASNIEHWG